MTALYNRTYRIKVGTLQIASTPEVPGAPALQVKFSVKKNLKPEPNKVEIKLYNLSATHRATFQQLGSGKGSPTIVPVSLEAGYSTTAGNFGSLLFLGDLRTALTVKDGPNFISHVSSGDKEVAIRTASVRKSYVKGTPTATVLNDLINALGVTQGNAPAAIKAISASPLGNLFPHGTVITGGAARCMTDLCRSVGYSWSVQNGALCLLPLGVALKGAALLVSSTTGMVGSPTVDNKNVVTVETLMIPDVFPGRLLVLDSQYLQGNYRIEEVTTTGDFNSKTDWKHQIKAQRY